MTPLSETTSLSPLPDAPAPVTPEPVAPTSPLAHTQKLKFNGSDRFLRELRKRVDAYFETTGRSRRDCPQMYFKTATIMLWFAATYILLMWVVTAWWLIVPLAILLGLSISAIGFNIQHDAGHKAYSRHGWINKTMAMTLDLMGGSSYMWDWKHNSIHHTYTNINGHDDDINLGALGRLSPEQPHYWFHRFQGIYLWLLYGFLAIKWHLFDDFYQLAKGRIGAQKIPRPKGKDLIVFISGKVVFFTLAFVLPIMFHGVWAALGVYALAAFVSGVVLSIVFQLAHCVVEADFPVPETMASGGKRIQAEWAVHQVQTTVDFAGDNRILGWFCGGLNFQIEHHLFHKICHIHYPALSKVVAETASEFGVRYTAHRSFWTALASHFKWLVIMGRPNKVAEPAAPAA